MSLRVTEIDGEPWFIAKDVCEVLGTRPDNLHVILDAEEIKPLSNSGLRGRAPLVVSESGMYATVMRSRKPEAKAFRKWVTSVVLPAIRRDGAYIRGEEHAKSDDRLVRDPTGENASRGWRNLLRNFPAKNSTVKGNSVGNLAAHQAISSIWPTLV